MNDRENRRYQQFGRVETFCRDHLGDFLPDGKAPACLHRLGQIITGLDAAKATQAAGGSTAKEVLLDGLRLDVQNVTRTARAIDLDESGFAAAFPPPATAGQGALLTAADAILARLHPQPGDDAATQKVKTALVSKFLAFELPKDFAQHLADDRVAIASAQDAVESQDQDGVESTAVIGKLIRDGIKEVTQVDAIMNNKYARVPETLRAWQSASHLERAPQREKNAEAANASVANGGVVSTPVVMPAPGTVSASAPAVTPASSAAPAAASTPGQPKVA